MTTTPQAARLQVNLSVARGASLADALECVGKVAGVRRVRQVFPGDDDPDLARALVADVDSARADDALAALRKLRAVEGAEVNRPRGVRPPPKRPPPKRSPAKRAPR